MKWLRNKIKEIKKWMCKKFGHSFTQIDKLMIGLKASAENVQELDLSITCCRCGEVVDYRKNMKL